MTAPWFRSLAERPVAEVVHVMQGSRYRLLSERGTGSPVLLGGIDTRGPDPSRMPRSESSLIQIGTEPTAGATAANGARPVPCPDGAFTDASVVRVDAPATDATPSRLLAVAGAQLSLEDVAA